MFSHSPNAQFAPQSNRPSLWSPQDRPGFAGCRDRLARERRLLNSCHLTDEQLRIIVQKMGSSKVKTGYILDYPDFVSEFVPSITEDTYVSDHIAGRVLRDLVISEMHKRMKSQHFDGDLDLYAENDLVTFRFMYSDKVPQLPPSLSDLPNVTVEKMKFDPQFAKFDSHQAGDQLSNHVTQVRPLSNRIRESPLASI